MRSFPCMLAILALAAGAGRAEESLVGHWKLDRDGRDSSGNGLHGVSRGVEFADGSAVFDGRGAFIGVPADKRLRLGKGDFTFAVWAHTAGEMDDVPGDLLSLFDPDKRLGVTWCIKDGAGATTSQANFRNVHFGIDAGTEPVWRDAGRPGNSVYDMALAVHDGSLYVGTCEPGEEEAGHVYRYAGGTEWVDCGSPDRCNAVTALAVFDGKLYAGVGRYRLRGSALPESANPHAGGKVYRYEGGAKWVDCGQLPEVDAVGGLAVFRGRLYATSLYRPAGFFRYEGGARWAALATPEGGRRVGPLGVFDGHLYAGSYDGCTVFRRGEKWEDLGNLEPTGQTYSFEVHRGELFVGTWPKGRVFRRAGGKEWVSTGRLGEELEVMGMAVYNGKLYAGTLPLAEVYRYDGDEKWARTGRLDTTPDVRYRRAWSVAVFGGRLFVGTLPSGRVHALEAGKVVTHDRALAPGWRHLAAVKEGGRLRLYVDGERVAESPAFDPAGFDLSGEVPLRIGTGGNDFFNGRLRDLRLYRRALGPEEVRALAKPTPGRRGP